MQAMYSGCGLCVSVLHVRIMCVLCGCRCRRAMHVLCECRCAYGWVLDARVVVVDLKVETIWQLNVTVWLGKTGQSGFGYEIHQWVLGADMINTREEVWVVNDGDIGWVFADL